jgi:hypothetical protein
MSTTWAITNAAERIVLDEQKVGEITFTVSNRTPYPDRAVFEVVPQDGAEASWFSTDEPQRPVPAGGSVAYLVKVTVPAEAAPGSHSLQGRVYSADSAPEEGSVLSGRILLDVAGAVPVPKRRPWWLLVVAGLVALVIGVVVWLLVPTGGTPVAGPSAAPTRSTRASVPASATASVATVPNLVGLTEQEAAKQLTALGLAEGKVLHRQDPAHAGKVLEQSRTLVSVPVGTKVDLVLAVSLAAPGITNPGGGSGFGQGSSVDVRWDQSEPWVGGWHVTTSKELCYYYVAHNYRDCRFDTQADTSAGIRLYTASFSLSYQPLLNLGWYNTGSVRATVSAVDDFGTAGPAATVQFHIG